MSDNERLSMNPEENSGARAKSSRKTWPILLVIFLLSGAATWFWLEKNSVDRDTMIAVAKEAIEGVKNKAEQVLPRTSSSQSPATESAAPAESQPETRSESQSGTQTLTSSEGVPTAQPSEGSASGEASSAGQDSAADSGQTAEGAENADTASADTQARTAADLPVITAPEGEQPEAPVTRGLLVTDSDQPLPSDLAQRGDGVVRVAFIDDLAKWMVAGYSPPSSRGGRGMISIGIQSANARYGMGMKGLSWIGDDLPSGRAEALRYVYTPGMLDALYRTYIDRFMEAMAEMAEAPRQNGKVLEPAHIAEMYRLYARRFRALSGAMQGVASLTDLRSRVQRILAASTAMVEANSRYVEEVFAFDQARAGGNETAIENTRKAMEASSDTYQQATLERDRQREELIGAIRNNPEARNLGDDNLLYVAMWVDRRLQQSPQALDATLQGATLFLDLAQRFEQVTGMHQ